MNNYARLLKFIPYFEDPTVLTLGYRRQDDEITAFVDESHQCGIINKEYFNYLQEKAPGEEYEALIPTADMDMLKALFGYYICQKPYAMKLWEEPIKKEIFLKLLYRLKRLSEA